MQHKYKMFKIKGQKFVIKMDLNPLTNEFEYHMYIRHLVTPQQAIAAYFSKTSEIYNEERCRYELYSSSLDITVYYTYLKEQDILLITAIKEVKMNKTQIEHIPTVGMAEVSDYTPSPAEEELIKEFELQADSDISAMKQTANVNFRWSEFEIKRAKKIACKLGMPYQTYLKSTLKQAMDRDEKKLM